MYETETSILKVGKCMLKFPFVYNTEFCIRAGKCVHPYHFVKHAIFHVSWTKMYSQIFKNEYKIPISCRKIHTHIFICEIQKITYFLQESHNSGCHMWIPYFWAEKSAVMLESRHVQNFLCHVENLHLDFQM